MPVFVMEGLSGAFFKPLALSYSLAHSGLHGRRPDRHAGDGLSALAQRRRSRHRESPLTRWLQRRYDAIAGEDRLANRARRMPPSASFALAGVLMCPLLGQSLLPDFKERDFLMHWLTKPGTSWPEMDRITIQASKELRTIPGVRNFGAHIGQALIMDEVVGDVFRRELDQRRSGRRLRRRRWPRFSRRSTATRACIATCRRI